MSWSGRRCQGLTRARAEKQEGAKTSGVRRQKKQASPVGDGEGDEGGVSEGLQDEGLQIGQLGSVGEPGPPRPANHSVCRARGTEKAEGLSPLLHGICVPIYTRHHPTWYCVSLQV